MYLILHNPLARNNKSKRTTKKVVDYFKEKNIPFRVKSLLKIKDIETFIQKIDKDVKILILGGDGTINTFINQTYKIAISHEIYLMSNGSGNDFLRTLKKQQTPTQNIMKMTHNQSTRYFINGSGLGIDGAIANLVNQSEKKNRLKYFIKTIKTFFTYKPRYMEAHIDGVLHRFNKAYLININNGEFIGGGMQITPHAKLDDDQVNVVIVHSISRLMLLIIFITVYFGKHLRFKKYIFHTKATHVKATMFSKQVAQCDGECFENTNELEVKVTNKYAKFKLFYMDQ